MLGLAAQRFAPGDVGYDLIDWRERCPRLDGELFRVFPTRGKRQPWPKPRSGGGGPLLYSNYRVQIWKPFLERLGLPAVTPHSARHSFISTLQAAGIEVATVAKLAGHANPTTTLSVYSHAVKVGGMAAEAIEKRYSLPMHPLYSAKRSRHYPHD
jgi:integrase